MKQYMNNDIIPRLAGETVRCSPETWERGTLSMQSDGVRLTYQLKSENHPDRALISELLRDLIDELYVRMSAERDAWVGATLDWWRESDGLKYNIDFDYPPKVKEPPSGKRSSWWSFGRR